MSRERKKSSRDQWPAVPYLAYTRFILFPFSSVFYRFALQNPPCSISSSSLLLSLLLIGVAQERLKAILYDSSKMQFDVARLLLEAEGVVNKNNK